MVEPDNLYILQRSTINKDFNDLFKYETNCFYIYIYSSIDYLHRYITGTSLETDLTQTVFEIKTPFQIILKERIVCTGAVEQSAVFVLDQPVLLEMSK